MTKTWDLKLVIWRSRSWSLSSKTCEIMRMYNILMFVKSENLAFFQDGNWKLDIRRRIYWIANSTIQGRYIDVYEEEYWSQHLQPSTFCLRCGQTSSWSLDQCNLRESLIIEPLSSEFLWSLIGWKKVLIFKINHDLIFSHNPCHPINQRPWLETMVSPYNYENLLLVRF